MAEAQQEKRHQKKKRKAKESHFLSFSNLKEYLKKDLDRLSSSEEVKLHHKQTKKERPISGPNQILASNLERSLVKSPGYQSYQNINSSSDWEVDLLPSISWQKTVTKEAENDESEFKDSVINHDASDLKESSEMILSFKKKKKRRKKKASDDFEADHSESRQNGGLRKKSFKKQKESGCFSSDISDMSLYNLPDASNNDLLNVDSRQQRVRKYRETPGKSSSLSAAQADAFSIPEDFSRLKKKKKKSRDHTLSDRKVDTISSVCGVQGIGFDPSTPRSIHEPNASHGNSSLETEHIHHKTKHKHKKKKKIQDHNLADTEVDTVCSVQGIGLDPSTPRSIHEPNASHGNSSLETEHIHHKTKHKHKKKKKIQDHILADTEVDTVCSIQEIGLDPSTPRSIHESNASHVNSSLETEHIHHKTKHKHKKKKKIQDHILADTEVDTVCSIQEIGLDPPNPISIHEPIASYENSSADTECNHKKRKKKKKSRDRTLSDKKADINSSVCSIQGIELDPRTPRSIHEPDTPYGSSSLETEHTHHKTKHKHKKKKKSRDHILADTEVDTVCSIQEIGLDPPTYELNASCGNSSAETECSSHKKKKKKKKKSVCESGDDVAELQELDGETAAISCAKTMMIVCNDTYGVSKNRQAETDENTDSKYLWQHNSFTNDENLSPSLEMSSSKSHALIKNSTTKPEIYPHTSPKRARLLEQQQKDENLSPPPVIQTNKSDTSDKDSMITNKMYPHTSFRQLYQQQKAGAAKEQSRGENSEGKSKKGQNSSKTSETGNKSKKLCSVSEFDEECSSSSSEKDTVTTKAEIIGEQKKSASLTEERQDNLAVSCYICHKAVASREDYIAHLAEQHQKLAYQCPKCAKTLSSNKQVDRHLRFSCRLKDEVNMSLTFQCSLCPLVYSQLRSLRRHQRTQHHQGKPPGVKCEHCNAMFTTRYRAREHVLKCAEGLLHKAASSENLECGECKKLYSSRESLYYHIRTVHKGHVFICMCGKKFLQSTHYYLHMKVCHASKPAEVTQEEVDFSS